MHGLRWLELPGMEHRRHHRFWAGELSRIITPELKILRRIAFDGTETGENVGVNSRNRIVRDQRVWFIDAVTGGLISIGIWNQGD